MKILIVVDMQNDFITGSLGSPEAQAIVPNVVAKLDKFIAENPSGKIYFTRDTHCEDYLSTQEGKNLPVSHCLDGEYGWQICDEIRPYVMPNADNVFDKPTFGSLALAREVRAEEPIEVELVGLCTGICVLANAITIKTFSPEIPITVDASCCACVTPESHKTALEAMKLLQINVIGE